MVEAAAAAKNRPEVEVRIYHATLDPERVSTMVGLMPTFRTLAGEVRHSLTTGRAIRGRTGTWFWRTMGASGDDPPRLLEQAIRRVGGGLRDVKRTWPDARVVFGFHLAKPDPSTLTDAVRQIGDLGEMEASVGADYAPVQMPAPAPQAAYRFG